MTAKNFLSFLIAVATISFFPLHSYIPIEELVDLETSIELADHLDAATLNALLKSCFSALAPAIEEMRKESENSQTRMHAARNLIALIPDVFDDVNLYFEAEFQWKEYHDRAITVSAGLLSRKYFTDLIKIIETIRHIKAFAPEFYQKRSAFTARIDSLGLFLKENQT